MDIAAKEPSKHERITLEIQPWLDIECTERFTVTTSYSMEIMNVLVLWRDGGGK